MALELETGGEATTALPEPATKAEAEVANPEERYTRYMGIIDPKLLKGAMCTIVGCGAIGRQVAIQLASMGVGGLQLIDHDKVESVNMGPQGWPPFDVGVKKAVALAQTVQELFPGLEVVECPVVFDKSQLSNKWGRYIFACVDNMDVRKVILDSINELDLRLFVDARMGAEVCRVYCVTDEASKIEWIKGWFPQSEAAPVTCTTRATISCACMAAAVMVGAFTKQLRKIALPTEVEVNMLAPAMTVQWPATRGEEVKDTAPKS